MESQVLSDLRRRRWLVGPALASGLLACAAPDGARAAAYQLTPDIRLDFSNTISYNLGMRAQSIDPLIANNPAYNESDYKFPHAGNIVTDRLEDLSELDLIYQGNLGVRVSGSAWKDFAYSDNVNTNPGMLAPGTRYGSVCSYCTSPGVPSGHYSGYTNHYYVAGGQLLDAFAFYNFNIGNHPLAIKIGRLTRYWGNSVFFGNQGISYSQNASDGIKGAAAPGTQAKELAIPRFQALLSGQIAPNLTAEGQYFGEFYGNRLPEGGTYLGTAGFLFRGPNYAEGNIPVRDSYAPSAMHANYGVRLSYSPDWLGGVAAAYFRHFDETQPWAPLFGVDSQGFNSHLAYARNVRLYGLSLDRTIGNYSVGLEASYRQKTALNSATQPLASDPAGQQGATGDTVNLIANTIAGLTPNRLWQTGTLVAEMAFTRVMSVNKNSDLYSGIGYAGCAGGGIWSGCSSRNSVQIAGQFDPQWLQVVPGVDLDAPIFAEYGLYGNAGSLGVGVSQGNIIYTAGLHALIRQIYNVTLAYNGYHAHHSDTLTNIAQSEGIDVPVGTPGFNSYYAGGNGPAFYNDRGWVSLTFSVAF